MSRSVKRGVGQESAADARILKRYQLRYREMAARLSQVGFLWHGSIHARWLTCGRADCPCAKDPQARHGPYIYWTSKENGRSVARLLHSPEAEILAKWVQNRQELEKTLGAMKKLSQKAHAVILRMSAETMPKQ